MPTADVDVLTENLVEWGRMARKMPPSFESDGITHQVVFDGVPIARMLPGRGVISLYDLKSLGITRQPPFVYDPSIYRSLEEDVQVSLARRGLHPAYPVIQGGAIASYDGIISARGGGKANDIAFVKTSITTVANIWSSLWRAGGGPAAGTHTATTAPTDRILDRATPAGVAISTYLANPAGTDKKYMLTFGFAGASQINMAVLVDILSEGGSFRGTVTTAETITTPTNTNREYGSGTGIGNLLTFIVATAGTGVAATFTIHYINQAGTDTTGSPTYTTVAVAATADTLYSSSGAVSATPPGLFFPLNSGDTGVRAVKSTTFSVAQTSIILASNVFFPLAFMPGLASNSYMERDSTVQVDGLTELINTAGVIGHLAMYVLPNTASSGVVTGFARTVSG